MSTETLLNPFQKKINQLKVNFKIDKGFSGEEKYCLSDQEGNQYLLRVCDIERLESAKNHFQLLQSVEALNIPMTRPIGLELIEKEQKVAMLLTYVEGVDGEESLSSHTEEEQYRIGLSAGEVLRKLHTIPAPSNLELWDVLKSNKHARYEKTFLTLEGYSEYKYIVEYIRENEHKLEGRPNMLLHDDFHPSNLIIHNKEFAGVIDFNRFEWGDPYHDLHKVALFTRNISVPFARGQIHGYFQGNPDEEFWERYTLYAAMAIISAIVWTQQFYPEQMEGMITRCEQIIKDHHNFQSSIPSWYRQYN
ncbi:aminoglycoside phosphotransferase family protein [Bacillus sp. 31A1R]|uniref:Aminoglycoside phosphotransferase family protein n=1 Tax=Robertmurraya mangrovi TaxID=3098077 RepID=A0ABU5J349_9BACI|nr:aminoglycoside phosphotransferase family protein [Bacillus sp. 31A1R]MDZ5473828.1 aminoglycoside phosphotransferase family protein [Bacillus sp. 31A1R]